MWINICFPFSPPFRGSKWCHIVPPAGRQEEEPWLLLPGIWRPQDSSSGPSQADEWQSKGVGKRGHRGVGGSHRGPWPRGHGQGKAHAHRSLVVFILQGVVMLQAKRRHGINVWSRYSGSVVCFKLVSEPDVVWCSCWQPCLRDTDRCFPSQVKVLFVRNLASTVTEEILEKAFSQFGKLERVKKLKDYAFIHFEERDGAVKVWRRKKPSPQTCIQDNNVKLHPTLS